jgi:Lipase maturation factor
MYDDSQELSETVSSKRTYWLTRYVLLRLLGAIYAVAFLVAINQLLPLIGSDGLTPLGIYLDRVKESLGSTGAGFWALPSLFWFTHSDAALMTVSWIGFILACLVAAGYANAITMAVLWMLYMSIVNAGQEWYGYGWEIQILETGFLAIFLCPLFDMRPFPRRETPFQIIVLFRWLVFRILLGAGLIKIRGDKIWRNGTALYYHFETQPLPGPLSRWFNFLPRTFLKLGVWFNWLAELVAPWFVFWPRLGRHIAGIVIILFQLTLIISGNLSFLNWLTIVPALACFDDGFWSRILPGYLVRKASAASENAIPSRPMVITSWIITGIIVLLSFQPTLNMLSPQQIMNTSFDPFDLVNTYGAFGTVGQERYNIVFEGTMDSIPGDSTHWKPYIYKGLPVALNKRPPQIAPYQLHLDWQMWFAAMDTPDDYPWTYNLIWKLLHNDPRSVGLFAGNPFPGKPPRYIRAELYRYSFAKPGNPEGSWWNRQRLGDWISATSVNDPALVDYVKRAGWIKSK